MIKKLLLTVVSALFIFSVIGCSQSKEQSTDTGGEKEKEEETIELKFGTKMPENSTEGKAFQKFADLVKEKTNGQIIVKVFPSEQLGKGTTQIDNLLMGTQDLYADGSAILSEYDSRLKLASAPYLYKDFEHFQKFNTGEVGQDIAQSLIAEEGMRILNTERNFVRGPYRVLLSTEPVKSFEDIQGLKVRSPESALYTNAWKTLGANPTVVAWSETYLALKQNMVEAVTSPISLVYSMKFAEVAPYMTIIDEYPQDVVFIVNEEKFQSLSKEQQDLLIEASNEAGAYGAQLAIDESEEHIATMKEENNLEVFDITDQNGQFVEKLVPFYNELEVQGEIPEGIIEKINSIK